MRWKGKLRRYPIQRRLPLDGLALLRPARPRVRGRSRHHLSGRGGVVVALDATKEQALQDVSLIKLFEDHRDLWKADAKSAYDFSAGFLDVVRPDDVLKPLLPVLEVAPKLRELSGAEQALPEVLVRTVRRAHHRPVVERADRRGEGWRERIGSDPPTPPASTWTTPSGDIRSRATKRPFRTTSTSAH